MIIIDATNLILGRMATVVAKKSLLGEEVVLINCSKAVLTGDKKKILAKFKRKREMGAPLRGPYIHRQPDKIVKRTIRGMLPYKQPKGIDAFKRIKCYVNIPESLLDKKAETIPEADVSKVKNTTYLPIGTISKFLGAKI